MRRRHQVVVRSYQPIHAHDRGVSHIAISVCRYMNGADLRVTLLTPTAEVKRGGTLGALFPGPWGRLGHLLRAYRPMRYFAATRFVGSLRAGDVAYIWPGTPLWVYREASRMGCSIVMERVNTHRATARRLLNQAYSARQLSLPDAYGKKAILEENAKLDLARFVFSPSPAVESSLLEAGVPARKILPSSYGWEPARIASVAKGRRHGEFVALFVGRLCLRKGVHVLLNAWKEAGVRGQLILVGSVQDEVAELCRAMNNRCGVSMRPYTENINDYLSAATVLVLPTLEEGSPLVVYEALASSLPVITTAIGAGEVVRHEREGLCIEPGDIQSLASALRYVSDNPAIVRKMAEAARLRASKFTWQQVGARRRKALLQALLEGGASRSELQC